MMITSLIGAATLALGHCNANGCNDQVTSPRVIHINTAMVEPTGVNRLQDRFSNETRGEVVGVEEHDGAINWAGKSDRELLGGQNAPQLIYVRIFDGTFAIDPFRQIKPADKSTAQMLFRGTTLETDRTQHGRQYIERTEELFRKLEQARVNWLRDNGFYGVRTITRGPVVKPSGNEAKLPEPAATFQRPPDMPRGKSREQVNADTQSMGSVAFVMNADRQGVRVSLPAHLEAQNRVSVIQRNGAKSEEVAINE